jgi:uncharacterized protein
MAQKAASATCLIVPGLRGAGPEHWQTLWEQERSDCVRVDLGCWSSPVRSIWVGRLDKAVMSTPPPVIIVAHSLGCLATTWWAAGAEPAVTARVRGALLVAPPDVEGHTRHRLLKRFAPEPDFNLPFPALLVASRNDPYATFERQMAMARRWGCQLVDIGEQGHINVESGVGDWLEGQILLDELIERRISYSPSATSGSISARARDTVQD